MPYRITEQMIKPNTDTIAGCYSSSWFSTVRSHYTREAGGSSMYAPTATQAVRDWRTFFDNYSGRFQTEITLSVAINEVKDQLKNLNLNSSRRGITTTGAVSLTLGMLNIYAEARKGMIDEGHFVPTRRNLFPTWKIDFICPCGTNYFRANKWEAKFHGRCMLNVTIPTLDNLRELFNSNNWGDAWERIFALYDGQRWINALANPRYLRASSTRPTTTSRARTTRPVQPIQPTQPVRAHSRTTSSLLGQEYLSRQEEDDGIITTRELGRMLSNSNIQLPADFRDLFHELLISLQVFQPLADGQSNPTQDEIVAMIREHFNIEQLSA